MLPVSMFEKTSWGGVVSGGPPPGSPSEAQCVQNMPQASSKRIKRVFDLMREVTKAKA